MFGKNEPRNQGGPVTNGDAHEDRKPTNGAAPTGRVQHSILSADVRLTGDLVSDGDITVEGTIDGSITCRSLTLAGQPTIKGTVEAQTAHVCGNFTGELRAHKVILNKTAKMRGDIFQDVLEVHPGADFEGKVAPLSSSRAKPAGEAKARGANGRDHTQESETDVLTPA